MLQWIADNWLSTIFIMYIFAMTLIAAELAWGKDDHKIPRYTVDEFNDRLWVTSDQGYMCENSRMSLVANLERIRWVGWKGCKIYRPKRDVGVRLIKCYGPYKISWLFTKERELCELLSHTRTKRVNQEIRHDRK